MTIRGSDMKIRNRKNFLVKVICIVIFCSLIIYALHFYRKVYNFTTRRSSLLSQLSDISRRGSMMESAGAVFGDGSGNMGEQVQGSPIVNLRHKIVHLDLKGMPPLAESYKMIFPFLRSIGVTGILIEYEDMFPYTGKLAGITNLKSYTPEEIKMILDLARTNHLQVIPLIQTFGHMEFVLKLEQFTHLREVFKSPQVICPTNNQSLELVKEMIDQVVKLHPDIEYLHIGSDEVYYIGVCPLCQDRLARGGIDNADLFLQHVKFVASYVKEKYKIQPLMWDDEFRQVDERIIRQYGIGDLVEIVVWNYHTDVSGTINPGILSKYASLFKSVWAGSAFKGADRPNAISVNESLYLTNHYSWMRVISENQHLINFKGIVLTGWQRYDHFSVLCEVLPAAIPSLVSCMFYLTSTGQPTMVEIFSKTSDFLKCESNKMFCEFPGALIYHDILSLYNTKFTLERMKEKSLYQGWTQDINLRFQFSNPGHTDSILQEVVRLRLDLQRIQMTLVPALALMFPKWSVNEWMLTHYQPLANEVNQLEEQLLKLSKKLTFPVRPLPYPDQYGGDPPQ